MPEITRFYGIVITMYFDDHNPPHIHAVYSKYFGLFNISDFKMTKGNLPIKAKKLVIEWMQKNKEKLLEIWDTQNFVKIEPLE